MFNFLKISYLSLFDFISYKSFKLLTNHGNFYYHDKILKRLSFNFKRKLHNEELSNANSLEANFFHKNSKKKSYKTSIKRKNYETFEIFSSYFSKNSKTLNKNFFIYIFELSF